jgi:acyl-CoA synthetase (AMP-forming)/AMP-acid ligase II
MVHGVWCMHAIAAATRCVPVWEISWDTKLSSIVLEPVTSVPVAPSTVLPHDFSPDAESIALILHTSGTTSRPKAVPLSHRNLCASIHNIALHYRLDPTYRSMVVMPLFHVHGLMGALLSTFHSGGSVVIPPKFSASHFWPDFLATKCNWYSAVPTIHQILLQHESTLKPGALPPARQRGGLRFIRSCSSALAPATFQQLEDTFGVPVVMTLQHICTLTLLLIMILI